MKDILRDLYIDPERYHVISLVGAGGKTTILYKMAEAFQKLGKKVIVTTTTHMALPLENAILTENKDIRETELEKYRNTKILTIGIPTIAKDGIKKMKGLPKDEMENLRKYCDVLLVEADGSKRMPIKAPESYEPVIPDITQLVIGVEGASAIGNKIEIVSCRTEKVCEIIGKNLEEIVTIDDLVMLLLHQKGLKKNVYCDYRAVINQADFLSKKQKAYAEQLAVICIQGNKY